MILLTQNPHEMSARERLEAEEYFTATERHVAKLSASLRTMWSLPVATGANGDAASAFRIDVVASTDGPQGFLWALKTVDSVYILDICADREPRNDAFGDAHDRLVDAIIDAVEVAKEMQ